MLRPRALSGEWQNDPNARHAGIGPFDRKWRKAVEDRIGGRAEVFAVVRDPVARLDSWYRYRQRNPAGEARSTQGLGFDDFLRAAMSDPVPDFARVGAQDRFTGWNGQRATVDVLFDYDRLDLMMDFLADRVGQRLHLPQKNVSAVQRTGKPEVPPELLARLRQHMAGEFALYDAVRETGVLFADD